MRLCSCLWGGCYNPIIPVTTTLPTPWRREAYREVTGPGLADAFIRFFEPDVFVEVEDGLAREAGIKASAYAIHDRVTSLDNFIVRDDRRRTDFAFGLNVFDAYRDLYERKYQFVAKKPRHFVLFDEEAPNAFSEAVFGNFPLDQELRYIRDAYIDVFAPDIRQITPQDYLEALNKDWSSPLDVSSYQLQAQSETAAHDGPTVYVFDPTKTVDLIDYWNIRQFRHSVLPVHIGWFRELGQLVARTIEENHRPLPGNPNGVMIHTTIEFSRSIPEARAKALITDHLKDVPAGSYAFKLWYDPIWRNNWRTGGIQPRRAKLTAAESDLQISAPADDSDLSIQSLSPKFAARYGAYSNHARWVNVVQLHDYSQSAHRAVTYLPNVKEPTFPRLQLGESTVIAREGIILFGHFKRDRTSLSLLPQQEAIIGWLKWRGIEAEPSDAGRNAEEVLRAAGGVRGCWAFADKSTILLLNKMAKTVRPESEGQITQLPDRTAGVSEWKEVISRRAKSQTFRRFSINTLIDKSVLRAGMVLKCSHCSKQNWFSIKDIDYQLTCERCFHNFPFPQGSIPFGAKDWHYRVIGPFSVPDYANGAYSTILTLRTLQELVHFSGPPMTFSTGLQIKDRGSDFELDFIAWYLEGRKFWIDPEPVLVFGETKSFGEDVFKQKDIERLRQIAEAFPGSNVVMSAMKPQFGDAEKARMRSLAEWGRTPQKNGEPRASIIVLTGLELFSDSDLKRTWTAAGGMHSALSQHASVNLDDLWTMADITQQLYLGLPSYSQWVQQRIRRRKQKQRLRIADRK